MPLSLTVKDRDPVPDSDPVNEGDLDNVPLWVCEALWLRLAEVEPVTDSLSLSDLVPLAVAEVVPEKDAVTKPLLEQVLVHDFDHEAECDLDMLTEEDLVRLALSLRLLVSEKERLSEPVPEELPVSVAEQLEDAE